MKTILLTLLAAAAIAPACAQIPFLTIDSININKINASVLVHGDMWWNGNPSDYKTKGFFPNGTRKTFGGFGNAVWMSGYDAGGQLHIAAQTYRQSGNDYWPGPLEPDTLTYHSAHDWAKIWKINRSDIQYFLSLTAHTTSNTPPMILTWPGKGSSYARGNGGVALTVSTDMAPFVDVNANGIYEPLLGDYPDIKGDQTLWWVFSDNGPVHTETNGKPLKVEVHAMAYAYSRGTLIDNVVYYNYEIKNKSSNNYNNFRFAFRADMDLGYFADDYIGYDSSHRMAIQYNATANDGGTIGNPDYTYGASAPVLGLTYVFLPGDGVGSYVQPGSFIYYYNDYSGHGSPTVDSEYNFYMRGRYRNGYYASSDWQGPFYETYGYGSGPVCNYVFPGNPADTNQWSECASMNPPGDRRFVFSSNDFTLAPGASTNIVMALVISDTADSNHCGAMTFDGIKTVADTAWHNYQNPPPPKTTSIVSLNSDGINIYPNPVSDILHIAAGSVKVDNDISVINTLGQRMSAQYSVKGADISIDVTNLPTGVYYCIVQSGDNTIRKTFVKQ